MNRKGYIFKINENYTSGMYGRVGDILVLHDDEELSHPEFMHITGELEGKTSYKSYHVVTRVYPKEVL